MDCIPFVPCRVHWPSFDTFTRSAISNPGLNVTMCLAETITFSPVCGLSNRLFLSWSWELLSVHLMHSFASGLRFAILARRPYSDYAEIDGCFERFSHESCQRSERAAAVESNGTG